MVEQLLIDPPDDVDERVLRITAASPYLIERRVVRAGQRFPPSTRRARNSGDCPGSVTALRIVIPGQEVRADGMVGAQGQYLAKVAEPPGDRGERGRVRVLIGPIASPTPAPASSVAPGPGPSARGRIVQQ